MASESSLGISFSLPSSSSSCEHNDSIVIEQEDWGKRGIVSKTDIADFLLRIFTTASQDTRKDQHGVEEDDEGDSIFTFFATVYVFINNPSLNYTFGVSYGTIIEDSFESEEKNITDILSCQLDEELKTKYPIYNLISIGWKGTAYDNNGIPIAAPSIQIVDNKIKMDSLAYGALEVQYTTIKHKRNIKIYQRTDTENNIFQSFAYVLTHCNANYIEIEPIPSVKDLENGMRVGSSGSVKWPDEKVPSVGGGASYNVHWDYCSGDLISDSRPYWMT